MATIHRFEELEIWKLARLYCKEIFPLTWVAPFSKDYRFRDQINDSSGSIMDNIAEGFERGGKNEFIQFLSIAKGSCGESRSLLYRALDRIYITETELESLVKRSEEISNKLGGFISYLNQSTHQGLKFKDRK